MESAPTMPMESWMDCLMHMTTGGDQRHHDERQAKLLEYITPL